MSLPIKPYSKKQLVYKPRIISFLAPMLTLVAYMQTVSLVVKLHCLPVKLLIHNSATYLSPLADVVKHFWNKQCYSCTKYPKLVDLAFILLNSSLESLTFELVHTSIDERLKQPSHYLSTFGHARP